MKDYGIQKAQVQQIETSQAKFKGFFGFRKMFWDYLTKLHVPFKDACCAEAGISDIEPIGYDESQGQIVRWDGSAWVPIVMFNTTTTTTTAAATTTTTTGA